MSLKAEMTKLFAKLGKADRKMALDLEHPKRGSDELDLLKFTKKVRVKTFDVNGFYGVTINSSYPKDAHILMLPGGAYTLEPDQRIREIAEHFAVMEGFRVSIFQYPLAPEYTALAAHQCLMEAYEGLIKEYQKDTFYLFGDFSGGGLALSFLQELRDRGDLPMPHKTAVVSPWLDIALNNPKIKLFQKTDFILPVEELRVAGGKYCGPLETDHPFVSPLYGDWNHLGPILVFSGTEEIMTPDCELLAEKAGKLEGTDIIYKKGAGMFHNWIKVPSKETDGTFKLICSFYLDEDKELI